MCHLLTLPLPSWNSTGKCVSEPSHCRINSISSLQIFTAVGNALKAWYPTLMSDLCTPMIYDVCTLMFYHLCTVMSPGICGRMSELPAYCAAALLPLDAYLLTFCEQHSYYACSCIFTSLPYLHYIYVPASFLHIYVLNGHWGVGGGTCHLEATCGPCDRHDLLVHNPGWLVHRDAASRPPQVYVTGMAWPSLALDGQNK